jgi:thiol-disulfide isomerase/thioredoxin
MRIETTGRKDAHGFLDPVSWITMQRYHFRFQQGKLMSTVREMLTAVALFATSAPFALAQATSAPRDSSTAESFEIVNKAWKDALKIHSDEYKAAFAAAKKKGDVAIKAFRFDKPLPLEAFSTRFLAVAERDPEGPDAVEALDMTLRTTLGPKLKTSLETRAKVVKILHDDYATRPSIKKLLPLLIAFDDEVCKTFVSDVIARNPDRTVQAFAYKQRIARAEGMAAQAEDLEKDPKRRAFFEERDGKAQVAEMIAKGAKAKLELEGLKKTLHEEYGDIINDLSIGKAAPEITIEALDGKVAKLSALKGKVVVLDIWTTWCKPCKAMIPHERKMVERLKGKPFELVSISCDTEKKALTDFLAKESMPWTHWWNGSEGNVLEDWDVHGFPTIFVLDAHGVIRHTDLRDEELEKAVNALLGETEKKTAGQTDKGGGGLGRTEEKSS